MTTASSSNNSSASTAPAIAPLNRARLVVGAVDVSCAEPPSPLPPPAPELVTTGPESSVNVVGGSFPNLAWNVAAKTTSGEVPLANPDTILSDTVEGEDPEGTLMTTSTVYPGDPACRRRRAGGVADSGFARTLPVVTSRRDESCTRGEATTAICPRPAWSPASTELVISAREAPGRSIPTVNDTVPLLLSISVAEADADGVAVKPPTPPPPAVGLAVASSRTEGGTDAEADTEADADADAEVDTDADADSGVGAEAETEGDAAAATVAEANAPCVAVLSAEAAAAVLRAPALAVDVDTGEAAVLAVDVGAGEAAVLAVDGGAGEAPVLALRVGCRDPGKLEDCGDSRGPALADGGVGEGSELPTTVAVGEPAVLAAG